MIWKGVGYHHAGLEQADRKLVEDLFARGELPVLGIQYKGIYVLSLNSEFYLVATSTLAMGVCTSFHFAGISYSCLSLLGQSSCSFGGDQVNVLLHGRHVRRVLYHTNPADDWQSGTASSIDAYSKEAFLLE